MSLETATKAVTTIVPPIVSNVSDTELDVAFDEGFLREWLANEPVRVKESLQTLISGLQYYRDKAEADRTNYLELQGKYNALMVQSAQHLEFMQQQRELLDETLTNQQREFHHRDSPNDGFTRTG
jgi:hypothetical protein